MKESRYFGLIVACLLIAGCSDDSKSESTLGKSCTDSCPSGYICKGATDEASGQCEKELKKGDNCGFKYTFCAEGLQCINGKCDEKSTEDKPADPGQVGGTCSEDKDCSRGKCEEGVCTIYVAAGQSCGKGRLCPSDYECHESVCLQGVEAGKDCRSSLVFCKDGGVCSAGHCLSAGTDPSECVDSDGDGIVDKYDRCFVENGEMNCTDGGDEYINDKDSDGDTIPDSYEHMSDFCEEPADSDGDGIYDFLDDDSDDNGIPDSVEGIGVDGSILDTDGDTIIDSSDDDNDGDGMIDIDEIEGIATNNEKYVTLFPDNPPRGADCYNAEKDFWGVYVENGVEKMGDGILDEAGTLEHPFDCDGDTVPDYMDTDSDNDTIPDKEEGLYDYDKDNLYDRYDLDSDNDGLSDKNEYEFYIQDSEALLKYYRNRDSDNDGLIDGLEVKCAFMECAGELVSINIDTKNCGACGNACPDGVACKEGACVAKCPEGMTSYNGACYDYQTDKNHCGSGTNACGEAQTCVAGECVCAQGQLVCGKECMNIDKDHCGGCSTSCTKDQKCNISDNGAACEDVADAGCETCLDEEGNSVPDCVVTTACWGICHDLQTDVNNCGECGKACKAGFSCNAGVCELVCAEGTFECNDKCIPATTIDVNNCGACGTKCSSDEVCAPGDEGVSCVASDVTCETCQDEEGTPKEDCEVTSACWGACYNLKKDVNNCGECGKVCAEGESCVDGSCKAPETPTEPSEATIVWSLKTDDADGDGVKDATEYAAALATHSDPSEYICNPKKGATSDPEKGIEGAFDFYFELKYCGDKCVKDKCCDDNSCGIKCLSDEDIDSDYRRSDNLNFRPAVSKLDLVFNVDTTNSMGSDVKNLQDNIGSYIIPKVRERVSDSAFGVSRFDDFPTHPTLNSKYDFLVGNGIEDGGYGRVDDCPIGTEVQPDLTKPFRCDRPFALLGKPETDPTTVQANVNKLGLHHGGDFPEAGFEALWQIVMGDDMTKPQATWYKYGNYTTFNSGSIAYTPKSSERWGGAQFRNSTLPVVIHITDTTAHDSATNCSDKDKEGNPTCKPYDPAYVENAHYSAETLDAYKEKGARVISIYDARDGLDYTAAPGTGQLAQLVNVSNETSAIVPVCAFKTDAENWKCGSNKCCTISPKGEAFGIMPDSNNNCVLSYAIEGASALSETLVDGVDALVKYATSEVAAIITGNPIDGSEYDTSCFIKSVEAFVEKGSDDNKLKGYVAPPQEPEASCNPVAAPAKFNGSEYNNGYTNFAIGTSSTEKEGSQLNFTVTAINDVCVKPTEQMQVFEAYIELIEPKTGMSFGKRTVSIVVPGEASAEIN